MAAGQGFKTFTTGEVLTAGDVNGYLMQGIKFLLARLLEMQLLPLRPRANLHLQKIITLYGITTVQLG
jgi:hypothetical protein